MRTDVYKSIKVFLVIIILLLTVFSSQPSNLIRVQAQGELQQCNFIFSPSAPFTIDNNDSLGNVTTDQTINLSTNTNRTGAWATATNFSIRGKQAGNPPNWADKNSSVSGNTVSGSFTISGTTRFVGDGDRTLEFEVLGDGSPLCRDTIYFAPGEPFAQRVCPTIDFYSEYEEAKVEPLLGSSIFIDFDRSIIPEGKSVTYWIKGIGPAETQLSIQNIAAPGGNEPFEENFSLGIGTYQYSVDAFYGGSAAADRNICSGTFSINAEAEENVEPGESEPISIDYDICIQAASAGLESECRTCMDKGDGNEGVWTAFGCITGTGDNLAAGIAKSLFRVGLGVAGGIALILILFGAFLTTTSGGDPERLKKGQETITSAIIGLVFIILSAVMLQFIGIELLQLPGLS